MGEISTDATARTVTAALTSPMRFYLDEDLSNAIAAIARDHYALDVVSSHDIGMDHATDEEQLTHASTIGRAIVTNNRDDFLDLSARFVG